MIKVMLVDDEILTLNYLRALIPWLQKGYQIVGCATNAQKAIELFEQHRPEIVISDIRMVGMDGLELAMRLKKKNPDTMIILISAYKDFDYAQKGIRYGVSNYLLKHELSEEVLLKELEKIRERLDTNYKKGKVYQQHFVKQLIYNQADENDIKKSNLGKRFFLFMLHKNNHYEHGNSKTTSWSQTELDVLAEHLETSLENIIFYVADAQITSNNIMALYKIENTSSKYVVNSLIEQKCTKISHELKKINHCRFNIIYSLEINSSEISTTFQRMSGQIRFAAFWESNKAYCLTKLSEVREEKVVWTPLIEDLKNAVYEDISEVEAVIQYIFELIEYPFHKLRMLQQLLYVLENVLIELEEKEGIALPQQEERIYKLIEIRQHYIQAFTYINKGITQRNNRKYSKIVLEIMRYVRKNYSQEMSLEMLGDTFQMSGIYLGQLFKKETGSTFLKYLTNYRIEEAQKLLEEGSRNITEVSEAVGYKTSQYFSQIFVKNVGIKPQEYKKWKEKR